MKDRKCRVLAVIVGLTALTIGIAAPSNAQEFGDPEFGPLVVSPNGGNPGDVVDGKVDTAVIAEQCLTDAAEVGAWFGHPWPAAAVPPAPGPVAQAWIDRGPLIGIDVPAVWPGTVIFGIRVDGPGPPPAGVEPQNWAWYMFSQRFLTSVGGQVFFTANAEQKAAGVLWEIMDLIGTNFDELAQEVLGQTFILTFADIETQQPIGALSTFDPATGFGQVTVPDVPPGEYAVAAACVEPVITDESFNAAVQAGAEYVVSNGVPLDASLTYCVDDPAAPFGECPGELLADGLSEVMLPELMQAQGNLWVELFCVSCDPLDSVNDAAAFCGVLPGVQGVPDRLATLFGGVAIDDPATFPSADELESLVNDVKALLDTGDTSVPPTVRPQWLIATEELRDLVFGLTAVGFDFQLVVDFAPDQAERLIDEGSGGGGPDPEFDAAIEVLTAFFVDNCVPPGGPGGEAGPATPTAGVARFTG